MSDETYDVIAVCQRAKLRPVGSVRLVQDGMKEKRALWKVAQMKRSTEGTAIDGQEFFMMVPHGKYKAGDVIHVHCTQE